MTEPRKRCELCGSTRTRLSIDDARDDVTEVCASCGWDLLEDVDDEEEEHVDNTVMVKVGRVVAHYKGGAYIDLYDRYHIHAGAYDCINVWDYESGQPTIPYTHDAVRAAVEAVVNDPEDGRGDPDLYH